MSGSGEGERNFEGVLKRGFQELLTWPVSRQLDQFCRKNEALKILKIFDFPEFIGVA